MNILITGKRFDIRVGGGSFIRDFACGLKSRGHSGIGFGSDPARGELLPDETILPIVTELAQLPFQPDIIYSHDHASCMMALTTLSGVPAVYHCHGAVWQLCPPKHPRIGHYLSMSRTLGERMSIESNISPTDITVFPNPVDLSRFQTCREPPPRLKQALFFNSRHDKDSRAIVAIREAVSRCGMTLDFIGPPHGELTGKPEEALPRYDVVFASGMSAIDALACGCAVVILGTNSCGELVTNENFDRLRLVNFSIASNSAPPVPDKIASELRRYSPSECAEVTRRLRRESSWDSSVGNLLDIFGRVIQENREAAPDLGAEVKACFHYLRKIEPLVSLSDCVFPRCWSDLEHGGSFDELNARLLLVEEQLKE